MLRFSPDLAQQDQKQGTDRKLWEKAFPLERSELFFMTEVHLSKNTAVILCSRVLTRTKSSVCSACWWIPVFLICFRVFVNRSLAMEKIKCFGFDMDYTLAGKTTRPTIRFQETYWTRRSLAGMLLHVVGSLLRNRFQLFLVKLWPDHNPLQRWDFLNRVTGTRQLSSP